ncbi:NAD-dependent epimerase/dehydratase family protein [Roseinatronobacter sp.]
MRVLVIGGSGFIGSHVVDALVNAGHTVRTFSRKREKFRPPLGVVDYHFGDVRDRMALAEALVDVDAVFHLVSTTFPSTANLDPKIDVQDNLISTLELIDTMLGLGINRLLFVSSGGTVYGIPKSVPIEESHSLNPINSYGIVKVAIEQYIEMYRRMRGLSSVIIRASNPFGPRQGHTGVQGVVSTFLDRALSGKKIDIWGDGTVVRDFIDVRDLAEFCVLAGTSKKAGIYNAGSGVGTTLNELIEVIREVTQMDIVANFKSARLVDTPISILDCSRAKEEFGWTAKRSLPNGIYDTWRWKVDLKSSMLNQE